MDSVIVEEILALRDEQYVPVDEFERGYEEAIADVVALIERVRARGR